VSFAVVLITGRTSGFRDEWTIVERIWCQVCLHYSITSCRSSLDMDWTSTIVDDVSIQMTRWTGLTTTSSLYLLPLLYVNNCVWKDRGFFHFPLLTYTVHWYVVETAICPSNLGCFGVMPCHEVCRDNSVLTFA